MHVVTRFLLCSVFSVAMLYSYVDEQNRVTRLRLQIPLLAAEVKMLSEENTRLEYQIDLFESPENLMRLAAAGSFSHLKHPTHTEVLYVSQGERLEPPVILAATQEASSRRVPLASALIK